MKPGMASKKMYMIGRIGLGMVFIVSGALKTADLTAFAHIIDAFAILPGVVVYPAAVLISFAELALGIGLVADIRGSLAGILGLLILFVFVLGWAIYMGYDIDCGCFGPEDPEAEAFSSLRTSLARDVVMILWVSCLYLWRRKNPSAG